jgi:hypothetical protein
MECPGWYCRFLGETCYRHILAAVAFGPSWELSAIRKLYRLYIKLCITLCAKSTLSSIPVSCQAWGCDALKRKTILLHVRRSEQGSSFAKIIWAQLMLILVGLFTRVLSAARKWLQVLGITKQLCTFSRTAGTLRGWLMYRDPTTYKIIMCM